MVLTLMLSRVIHSRFKQPKEMWRPPQRMYTFFETMAKRIGPKAETEEGRKKLLIVDGEPDWFPPKYGPYMNYFILPNLWSQF